MSTSGDSQNSGLVGEQFVADICELPFGRDFLSTSPLYSSSTGDRELCDLLLLFDRTAVLFEVKTSTRAKGQLRSDADWRTWYTHRVRKAQGQLGRGVDALKNNVSLKALNRHGIALDTSSKAIDTYHAVCVIDRPPKVSWDRARAQFASTAPLFATSHSELHHVLTELSTANDLINFLDARANLIAKRHDLPGTELDLLAVYKADPDNFESNVEKAIRQGEIDTAWNTFEHHAIRTRRAHDDQNSYLIDAIIEKLYTSIEAPPAHADLPATTEARCMYFWKIIYYLARTTRLERRSLGDMLQAKSELCVATGDTRYGLQLALADKIAYLLIVTRESDRVRRFNLAHNLTSHAQQNVDGYTFVTVCVDPTHDWRSFAVDILVDESIGSSPTSSRERSPLFGSPRRFEVTEFRHD